MEEGNYKCLYKREFGKEVSTWENLVGNPQTNLFHDKNNQKNTLKN
jgi:hypothetical protein